MSPFLQPLHSKKLRMLLLAADQSTAELLSTALQEASPQSTLKLVTDIAEAESALLERDFHCILLDSHLSKEDGSTFIKKTREARERPPVILLAHPNADEKITAWTKAGALDYLPITNFKAEGLAERLSHALWVHETEMRSLLVYEKLWLTAQIIESTLEGIFVTEENGTISIINPAFSKLTGYEADDVIGTKPELFQAPGHPATINPALWQQLEANGSWQGELWIRHKSGQLLPVLASISQIKPQGEEDTHYVAMLTNLSQQKQTEQKMERMAYYDPLTNLPNRSFLLTKLNQELEDARTHQEQVGILFLDLDRFKVINDTLGHSVGDVLLQQVAERLSSCLGPLDTLARLGGDEFTILLPRLESSSAALTCAEKVLESLKAPFFCGDHELHVTTSIGISVFPNDGLDGISLLKNADSALYRAKKKSRNTYQVYSPTLNAKALEQLVLENSLRHALERQEFKVYYQPRIQISTGKIVGAEALLRWEHPDLGLISPSEFLPLAEEAGLMAAIDGWVLATACLDAQKWQTKDLSLQVAVNISGQQLRQPHFVEQITTSLQESQLPATCLELEITENIVMENPEAAINTFKEVKGLGVHLSIDDFGTGYSSLSHLKRFPIDTVKIDRSFIKESGFGEDDMAIVTAIVSMSHSLNLQVVAEGVETPQKLRFLHSLKCDSAQGYLFSAPIPNSTLKELISSQPYLTRRTKAVIKTAFKRKSLQRPFSYLISKAREEIWQPLNQKSKS